MLKNRNQIYENTIIFSRILTLINLYVLEAYMKGI